MEEQATVFMPVQAQSMVVSPPANRTHLPTIRGLAVTQIIVGISSIIIGIASVASLSHRYWLTHVGGGIWGGVVIMVTGIIGISSSRNLSSGGLNAIYLTFCIISSVVAFFDGIIFIFGVIHYSSSNYYSSWCGTLDSNELYLRRHALDGYAERSRGLALYIPLMILMIIEIFISIIAASKNSNCCCAQQRQGVVFTQQYQMVASSQGQTIVYPVSSCPAASYTAAGNVPTHSTVPSQQMGVVAYSSQMVLQPPPYGGMYVSTQGQHMPAQTNITYSTQPPAYSMVPPHNDATPPPYAYKDTTPPGTND